MLVKDYVLPQITKDPSIKTILDTQQKEIDDYNFNIKDLINQCFLSTATWGLVYWENPLGITPDSKKTFTQRREIIKSSLVGHGVVTTQLIKDTASAYANGEVEVTDNVEPFTFEIRFTGNKGLPQGLDELKKRIDIIKPAHLLVKYVFTYNTYADIQALQYKTMDAYTWVELNSGELSNVFSHNVLTKYTHQQLGGIL